MGDPVSSAMAGRRMVTADVLALTTNVEMHAAARTPLPPAEPAMSEEDLADERADSGSDDTEHDHGEDERVIEEFGAQLRSASLVEVGGGDLGTIGGKGEHAGERAGPHAADDGRRQTDRE